MAGQLFKRYSGRKNPAPAAHSWLTHLGDRNVNPPLLMAISGHKRLATLQRYVKPSQAAAAALMAASDPRPSRPLTMVVRDAASAGQPSSTDISCRFY